MQPPDCCASLKSKHHKDLYVALYVAHWTGSVVYYIVASCLDYCNSLLSGAPSTAHDKIKQAYIGHGGLSRDSHLLHASVAFGSCRPTTVVVTIGLYSVLVANLRLYCNVQDSLDVNASFSPLPAQTLRRRFTEHSVTAPSVRNSLPYDVINADVRRTLFTNLPLQLRPYDIVKLRARQASPNTRTEQGIGLLLNQ